MRWVLIGVFNLFFISVSAQQRPMLTQYLFNGLTVNPAYSALGDDFNIAAIGRQQWVGFDGAPNTQYLSGYSAINRSNSSIGLVLMRDNIGDVLTKTGSYLTFAQRMKLSEQTYLAVGGLWGIEKYAAKYSDLWDSASSLDPVFRNESILSMNFGLGVMLFSDRFYLGLSSPFLLSSNLDPTQYNADKPHYMFQAGYINPLSESFKLKHTLLLKYVKGAPVEADVSSNVLLADRVWLGVAWRSFDSIDGILQILLSRTIQVGYAYDFTTTKIGPNQSGSHELMIKFTFPRKDGSNRCYF